MGLAFYGRATRNFLGLLCLMHFVLFLERINLAAAATTIQKDLGLSNIALGLAFSAFNYSYAPFQMVGGWFADRFGARRTLTVCGLAWSIATIATAAVNGLGSLATPALCARHGRECDLAGGNACVVQLDSARHARHGDRHHPFRRARRFGDNGAGRRLSDHLVFLAFFIRGTRYRVAGLGGPVVVAFP